MKNPKRRVPEALGAVLLGTPATALASEGAAPSLLELAVRAGASLAAVVALIVLLAFLVRRLRAAPGAAGSGRRLASLARLDLGARREIRLVRVDDHTLVLGVTGDRISLLGEASGPSEDGALDEGSRRPPLQILRELTTSS